MILSDRDIHQAILVGRIAIDPFDDDAIQPSSIDVCVSNEFRVFANHRHPFIDPRERQDLTELVVVPEGEPFMLHPGEFVLGSTVERVALSDDMVARLERKSSLGRLGLLIHSTAGFFDPGFEGRATLELSNVSTLPIAIWPGMRIGQFAFTPLSSAAAYPYGSKRLNSKYQGQSGPTASRFFENYRHEDE